MNPQDTIGITALGMINALGASPEDIWAALLDSSRHPFKTSADYANTEKWVGRISVDLSELPLELPKFKSRNNQIALHAFRQIEAQVQNAISLYGPSKVGVVIGSSTSGISEGEEANEETECPERFPEHYYIDQQELGSPALFLREMSRCTGPAFTISTACSSSAKAFASARNLIEIGLVDAVIVGGVDSLCKLTIQGFSTLELVSETPCIPFSANRSGITIGEGAALFLLERNKGEVELLGVGESSDAYHMSTPHPEGLGAEQAIQQALNDAQLKAEEIHYINLHGTGTKANDQAEGAIVAKLFPSSTPCSSTKGMTGHLLGASGATEAAFCWLALSKASQQVNLPPHTWDGVADADIPPLNFAQIGDSLPVTPQVNTASTSFAFGGNNCCLILGRKFQAEVGDAAC